MKKVELQFTPTQLKALVYSFNFIQQYYPKTRKEKVNKSILIELVVKIEKKHCETKGALNTLFSKPKKSKLTLKYYEADCLEQYLLLAVNQPLNEYDRNAISYFITKLNQQLA